ncbi:MAG: biotin-dependent carboxyltransferase family protein [Kangiellaceae bacterium]
MLFLNAGLQTSIQDLGRAGYMHVGVSQSGAMDKTAFTLANSLVGNSIHHPALEITLIGPKIQFQSPLSIAICGAQFDLYLNNEKIFNNKTIQVTKGDILEFDKLVNGARCYLAFSGELDLKKQLGSFSTNLTAKIGGYHNRQIKKGDLVRFISTKTVKKKSLGKSFHQPYSGKYLLRCTKSVESDNFSDAQHSQFFTNKYKVSQQSNRMGIRLDGKKIVDSDQIQITSSGLTQGSIQITPSGLPIISSVDGQTIGGYPRIANVISADLSILGQLKANDIIGFEMVSNEQAHILYTQKENWLSEQIA